MEEDERSDCPTSHRTNRHLRIRAMVLQLNSDKETEIKS